MVNMQKILDIPIGKATLLDLLLLLGLSCVLLGCSGIGGVVPVDDRILFGGNTTGQGRFHQGQLTVDYRYRLTGGQMHLDGQVDYSFPVDLLDLRLLFLNQSGKVVERKIVYSTGYRLSRSWTAEHTFQETLTVPTGAVGISFDYSVQLRSSHK